MILEYVSISLVPAWDQSAPARYQGTVKFKGENGSVTLNLNDEISRQLLSVVGDQVLASSRAVSQYLVCECEKVVR